jgi:hypothetical protein
MREVSLAIDLARSVPTSEKPEENRFLEDFVDIG